MKKGICFLCKKEKNLNKNFKKEKICYGCYLAYVYVRKICDICQEYKIIKSNKNKIKICNECYKIIYTKDSRKRPLHICSVCGNLKKAAKKLPDEKHICHGCYEPPLKICYKCGQLDSVHKYINKMPVCIKCYEPPKRKCSICKKEKPIHKKIDDFCICQKCYIPPPIICSFCNKPSEKSIKNIENKQMCKNCYDLERLKKEEFRIQGVLRKRLRDALKSYSKIGKIKRADEYGINYQAIIEYLGPCPGNSKDYHIDHIFPLVAFDFDDLAQIKKAFAPENHQWLKKEDNLKKHSSFVVQELFGYLNK